MPATCFQRRNAEWTQMTKNTTPEDPFTEQNQVRKSLFHDWQNANLSKRARCPRPVWLTSGGSLLQKPCRSVQNVGDIPYLIWRLLGSPKSWHLPPSPASIRLFVPRVGIIPFLLTRVVLAFSRRHRYSLVTPPLVPCVPAPMTVCIHTILNFVHSNFWRICLVSACVLPTTVLVPARRRRI